MSELQEALDKRRARVLKQFDTLVSAMGLSPREVSAIITGYEYGLKKGIEQTRKEFLGTKK